jgi:hypothetical protein
MYTSKADLLSIGLSTEPIYYERLKDTIGMEAGIASGTGGPFLVPEAPPMRSQGAEILIGIDSRKLLPIGRSSDSLDYPRVLGVTTDRASALRLTDGTRNNAPETKSQSLAGFGNEALLGIGFQFRENSFRE